MNEKIVFSIFPFTERDSIMQRKKKSNQAYFAYVNGDSAVFFALDVAAPLFSLSHSPPLTIHYVYMYLYKASMIVAFDFYSWFCVSFQYIGVYVHKWLYAVGDVVAIPQRYCSYFQTHLLLPFSLSLSLAHSSSLLEIAFPDQYLSWFTPIVTWRLLAHHTQLSPCEMKGSNEVALKFILKETWNVERKKIHTPPNHPPFNSQHICEKRHCHTAKISCKIITLSPRPDFISFHFFFVRFSQHN